MTEEQSIHVLYVLGMLLAAVFGVFFGKGKKAVDLSALKSLGQDLPTLLQSHEAATRKASEYLAKIEEVIMERNTWRDLYNDQAAGHDNAQALMMRTISSLCQAYRKETGKDFRLDPILDLVREDWAGKHSPARADKPEKEEKSDG